MLKYWINFFSVCPDGYDVITLSVEDSGFKLTGMGALGSDDPFAPSAVNPEDAIVGTGKSITLCEGDAFIVKPWCEPPEATILDVMLYVKGVKVVNVYFLDSVGELITSADVSLILQLSNMIFITIVSYSYPL